MNFVPTHFSIDLYVSDIIKLKVANMPEMMNFPTYTYFKGEFTLYTLDVHRG